MTRPLPESALRDRWTAHTQPTGDGHLLWTGPEKLAWRGRKWRPAALAFHLRTGREPDGHARADCGHHGCVLPAHVDDGAGRRHTREQLRALLAIPARAACRRGHPAATAGRYRPDGIAYCEECRSTRAADRKAAAERAAASGRAAA
jgi:hypothetical protein